MLRRMRPNPTRARFECPRMLCEQLPGLGDQTTIRKISLSRRDS